MAKKTRNGYIIFIIAAAITLSGSPLMAAVDIEELEEAITISREALISQQQEEGYWFSLVETNTIYNSLQILLYYYLNKEEEESESIEGLCNYLVATQSEDGSWPLYDGGPPVLGLTTVNYFALKLAGYQQDDPILALAREFILSRGGAESIGFIHSYILSLFDQFSPPSIPELPLLPVLNFSSKLSWFRIMSIPFLVVLKEDAFFKPPSEVYIDELFLSPSEGRVLSPNEELISVIEAVVDEAEKEYGENTNLSLAAGSDPNQAYVDWLLARQNTNDGLFYDYMPTNFFSIISLKALEGHINSEEAINRALQGLRIFQQHLPEGIYQAPSDSAIWDTGYTIWTLFQTKLSPEDPSIQKGIDFLWSRQHSKAGDWINQLAAPVSPGGWGFTLNSESYPDADDTAMTLFLLREIYGDNWYERESDFTRGLDWLLAMQNPNGGWGTWDRQSGLVSVFLNNLMKSVVGPIVLNESVVDHTTRVLMALSSFGYTAGGSWPVRKAVKWIKGQQLEDGSWPGTWAVDYIYQTSLVLGGLSLVKAKMSDDFIQKSLNYILEKQREDGGWGESPLSFSAGHYLPLGYSSTSQTAMILFGLFHFLKGTDYQYTYRLKAPIENAINFLLASQGEDGLWKDPTYVAVVFPEIQYARYPIFRESVILSSLGMYYQAIDRFLACSEDNLEICDGQGIDEDCDGLIDCDDPNCDGDPNCAVYTGTANAEAATYGYYSLTGSGILNSLALLLFPAVVIIFLKSIRKRN